MGFNEAFIEYMKESFGLDVSKKPDETDAQHKARMHENWLNLTPAQKIKLKSYLLS